MQTQKLIDAIDSVWTSPEVKTTAENDSASMAVKMKY